jgi:mRNA interferase MazF
MAEGIKLKRGLIIEVNLDPTRGSETGKIRPCIIVTNNTYNERVPIIQVVPITAWSEKKAKIRSNVEIEPSEANGLTKKSGVAGLRYDLAIERSSSHSSVMIN